jgi:hypothetical protein
MVALATISPTPEGVPLPTSQPTAVATAEIVITEEPTLAPTLATTIAPTSTPLSEEPGGGSRPLNTVTVRLGDFGDGAVVGAFVYGARKKK